MSAIAANVSYDYYTGRLFIEPEFEKPGRRTGHIIKWLSEKGLPPAPSEFQSSLHVQLSQEKRKIESEIEGLLFQVQHLYRDLHTKGLALRTYKHILAPIRRISQEVLRQIFTFLAPDYVKPWETLVPLLEVCQLWRSTIYDMPVMWENVRITGRRPGEEGWLAQNLSKANLTGINIEWRGYWPIRTMPTDLEDALLSRCQLWWRLNFQKVQDDSPTPNKLLDALRGAGSLRELTWCERWYKVYDPPVTLPSLRILRLYGGDLPAFILPSLTHLSLGCISLSREELYRFADGAPNLRNVTDYASWIIDEGAVVGWEGFLSSPPKLEALAALHVQEIQTIGVPLWLPVAACTSSLRTVLLTAEAISNHRSPSDLKDIRIQHVRTLILVLGWDDGSVKWIDRPSLQIFHGVENLDLRQEAYRNAHETVVSLLQETSCTSTDSTALFPHLKALSLSFNYPSREDLSDYPTSDGQPHHSSIEALSDSVYKTLRAVADAGFVWQCPVSLRVEDGIVFFDATAEEFEGHLRNLKDSWPSIDAVIRKRMASF